MWPELQGQGGQQPATTTPMLMRGQALQRGSSCLGRRPAVVQPRALFRGAIAVHAATPSAAETARTIMDIVSEGTLSSLTPEGMPLGTPCSFALDKAGDVWLAIAPNAPEKEHLQANPRCSLMVQPNSYPARSVAAVSLLGRVDVSGESPFKLQLERAVYFGGLDGTCMEECHASCHVDIEPADFLAAEPDVLRKHASGLVQLWNDVGASMQWHVYVAAPPLTRMDAALAATHRAFALIQERAEDLYRIISYEMRVPINDMVYAELVWVDRLGMYVKTEVKVGGRSGFGFTW